MYKNNTTLIPPASEAGLLCVKSCNSDQQLCNSQCFDRYERCKAGLSSEINAAFDRQTQIYLAELDSFERNSRHFNHSYNQYLSEKTKYQNLLNQAHAACDIRQESACKEEKALEQILEDLRKNYYFGDGPLSQEPKKPSKPDFSQITNAVVENRCSKSCNCGSTYQGCFSHCGGSIKTEQVCVENCE